MSQPATSLRLKAVSDERLIAKLRAGDSRAFEAIYDRYERPIRSFCRHMLGQPEDADDAAQHTFLAAYRELVGSEKAIDLRPWLFTIARNRCRTLLRARYRGLAFCESMEYEPSVEGLTVEVERREQLRDLMRDIARLPEDQRAALLLTQLETLRHDEVARVLDVPAEKVKALVFQARSSLVASELARATPCLEIREQLATLSGAALRRRTLRRHVRDCAGCREFEQKLRYQRKAILALLPVTAAPAVRKAVAAHVVGGGGGAAGGLAAGGGGAAAGGGFSGIIANAIAVKAAAVLSVAAAGAGVVAVTSHTRAAGAVKQAVAETHGESAVTEIDGSFRGAASQPSHLEPGGPLTYHEQPVGHEPSHVGEHAPPADSHPPHPDGPPPSGEAPHFGAAAPVATPDADGDHGTAEKEDKGDNDQDDTSKGQAKQEGSDALPPGQEKKLESEPEPNNPAEHGDGGANGNGNANANGNGNENGNGNDEQDKTDGNAKAGNGNGEEDKGNGNGNPNGKEDKGNGGNGNGGNGKDKGPDPQSAPSA